MRQRALDAVFFLSGCAALLFETLWFRQAGLLLGNSVWASAIVLASFMTGLALGNLGAARLGARLRRPLLVYAGLEALIAATGLLLVLALPLLPQALAPLLAEAEPSGPWLNGLRLGAAFALFAIPSSAMGATLPVLVAALGGGEGRFGRNLGRLYGWNTLGAVAGALAGELVLIERFGLRGTGALAATLDLLAALAVLRLEPSFPREAAPELPARSGSPLQPAVLRLLAGAGLAGALLLALEVVWFRFLLLFTSGTSAAFAIMLAAVLAGIGLGGLTGSAWLARRRGAEGALPAVALLAGLAAAWSYAGFAGAPPDSLAGGLTGPASGLAAAWLMLPTSWFSGLLFTLLGQALRARLEGETRTAGWLTLANTLGALAGPLVGGLWLLPRLGVEGSLLLLACGYALVAALLFPAAAGPVARRAAWACAAAVALSAASYPQGLMRSRVLPRAWAGFGYEGLLALREGTTETIGYVAVRRWNEPLYYRLVTNGHSMSSTSPAASRYMRLFSYLPLALRPRAASALVISFGLGSTVEALTESPWLRSIDVVDISRDILELGRLAYPAPRRYPLDDARVRVRVEDGRFHLLTTRRRYDVITAEPPPPKNAGVVNLYSREYFALVRGALNEGGVASHWLPVHNLSFDDARAITQAFCGVFEDCTLWTGAGYDWLLVGTRGLQPPGDEGFGAPWGVPALRASLEEIGLARPEQVGTTFLADAVQLREWLGAARPLVDDFPLRLSVALPARRPAAFERLADPEGARRRFAESAWVARFWPPGLRAATLERFPREAPLLRFSCALDGGASVLPGLAAGAGDPLARTALLWMMGSSQALQAAARRARERGLADPAIDVELGVGAFSEGRFLEAEELFARAAPHEPAEWLAQWRVLALALAGERQRAAALVRGTGRPRQDVQGWGFLAGTFGLPDGTAPHEAPAAR